jgi:hypothetical protein
MIKFIKNTLLQTIPAVSLALSSCQQKDVRQRVGIEHKDDIQEHPPPDAAGIEYRTLTLNLSGRR